MRKINLVLVTLIFFVFNSCKKTPSNNDYLIPIPVLTSISPNTATAGDPAFTMVVNGNNFTGSSVIKWNGIALVTNFISTSKLLTVISDSLIRTGGTDSVFVMNPSPAGGNSNKLPFYCGSSTNNPIPVINSLSPSNVTAGSANFTLTINGDNFINGAVISWNGIPLTTTFVNSNQLSAVISSSMVITAGNISINVLNPQPGGGNSNNSTFFISVNSNNPVPSISTVFPNSTTAGSSSLTLTVSGNNFTNNSFVYWNGIQLTTTFINSNQITAVINASLLITAGVASITVVNPTPGGGTTLPVNFTITAQGTAPKRFLFDATKAETAGNADWVIDEDNSPQQIPTPAQTTINASTSDTYWTGALSSWGIALAKLGQYVETLPSGSQISYGNSGNPQDLSNYDVFVIDEPNTRFTTAEKQAILNFISNGGGLFMISDHTQSDRDNDGWDSPAIWNDFMTNNGIVSNPFGFSVDLTNISGLSSNVLTGNSTNVLLHGSQGDVTQVSFSNGATLSLSTSLNPSVQGLIWENGYSQTGTHVLSATSTYGSGRVYVITDSSPMDDGTGSSGNVLYTDWTLYSHSKLFLNASLWLAKLQ